MHATVQHLLREVISAVSEEHIGQKKTPNRLEAMEVQIRNFLLWLADAGHLTDFQIYTPTQLASLEVKHTIDDDAKQFTINISNTPLQDFKPFEYTYACEICHAFDDARSGSSHGKFFANCPLCKGGGARPATLSELECELARIEVRTIFLDGVMHQLKDPQLDKPVVYSSQRPDHALNVALQKLNTQRKGIEDEYRARKDGTGQAYLRIDIAELFLTYLAPPSTSLRGRTRDE